MSDAVLIDILNELVKLNKNMDVLVNEHLKHFNEWRVKNV